jgi:hypothetical protein
VGTRRWFPVNVGGQTYATWCGASESHFGASRAVCALAGGVCHSGISDGPDEFDDLVIGHGCDCSDFPDGSDDREPDHLGRCEGCS